MRGAERGQAVERGGGGVMGGDARRARDAEGEFVGGGEGAVGGGVAVKDVGSMMPVMPWRLAWA